jgi:hypothetical protein
MYQGISPFSIIFHPHIGAMINKISTKQIKRSGKRILALS